MCTFYLLSHSPVSSGLRKQEKPTDRTYDTRVYYKSQGDDPSTTYFLTKTYKLTPYLSSRGFEVMLLLYVLGSLLYV